MKFFLDANLPYSAKKVFEAYGEVSHTRDEGLGTASDREIFDFVVQEKMVLVTKDLDFGNPFLFPRGSLEGLVILRVPFYFIVEQINSVLEDFLSSTSQEEILHSIIVIGPGVKRTKKIEK